MAEFLVKLADERGRVLEQTENASSESDLRERFTKQGFYVYSVRSKGLFSDGLIGAPRRKKVKQADFAVFNQQFYTLIHAGLPIPTALETAGASIQSRSVARASLVAAERVREGISLSTSLEETKMFPDLALEMLEVGESTGSMREMLNSVAEFYEEDVENATAAAMSLIEPALLIFVAIFIGFVLISLYLPIFSIGSALGTQH
jgi:type II secretory pathway component PulF